MAACAITKKLLEPLDSTAVGNGWTDEFSLSVEWLHVGFPQCSRRCGVDVGLARIIGFVEPAIKLPKLPKLNFKNEYGLNGLPKQVGRACCDCCSRSARPSVNIIRAPASELISVSIIWNDGTSRQMFLQHWSKFYAMIQSSIGKVVPIICPL